MQNRFLSGFHRRRRNGFTLIELVVVILVIAIVSGLVVASVGWIRRFANYATQSHNQASLTSNLEMYRTTYGNDGYPDNLDSLVITGTSDPIYSVAGYTDKGHSAELYTVGDLDADERASLKWLNTVYDHDTDKHAGLQGNPGNSAIHERTGFDGTNVAIVGDSTTAFDGEGLLLVNEIYPNGVPEDVTLVAFGIGPRNTAVGTTMQSAPLDARVDNSEVYGRFIGVFACYSPRAGRRAELKAVLNAKARTQNNALSETWQSANPE